MLRNVSEDTRRITTRVTAWGAWLMATFIAVLSVLDVAERAWGIVAVIFIGIAIAAGSALSRMHLTDAIVGSFRAGLKISEDHRKEEIEQAVEEVVRRVR